MRRLLLNSLRKAYVPGGTLGGRVGVRSSLRRLARHNARMGILDRFRRDHSTSTQTPENVEKLSIMKIDGEHSLTFYCGELAVDEEIALAGHEPNGYFWDGVVSPSARIWPSA